jgi:hypothetical protein
MKLLQVLTKQQQKAMCNREEQWVQRLNRAITRSRDTARGEISGALGRLSKGVSNYQNNNANVERMLNDGTVLVLG